MQWKSIAAAAGLAAMVVVSGCGKDDVDSAKSGMNSQMSEIADKAQGEYLKMAEEKLQGFEAKIGDLRVQVDKLPENVRATAHAKLDGLESTLNGLKSKMSNMEGLSADALKDMKGTLESAMAELEKGFAEVQKMVSGNN